MHYAEPEDDGQRVIEELKESERKYRDLADSLPQTVAEIDLHGTITFTNVNSFSAFGYTREDFTKGVNIFQMIIPEDRERARENIRKFLKGQKLEGGEYTGLRKNGSTFPVMVYLTSIFKENTPVGFRAIVIDITEQKKSEEALRASQLQLSQAMDLVNLVCWESDPTDKMFIFNDPFYTLYGTTAEQERGYRMSREEYTKRFVHPDDRLRIFQIAEQVKANPGADSITGLEHRIIRRDGETRHILVRTSVAKDDSGRLIKRYGVNQDITERKQAEEAMTKYRVLSEGSRDIMLFIGMDGRIIEANKAAEIVYGYTREELLNLNIRNIRAAETLPNISEQMHQAGSKGILFETIHRRKDGTQFPVEVSSQGAVLGGNQVLLSVVRDTSERKETEAALRQTENRYHSLFETSPDSIFMVDQETGSFIAANDAACRLYGYTKDEFLSMKHTDLSAEPEKSKSAMRDSETSVPLRYHRKKDGTVFPVEIAGSYFMDGGRALHTAFIRDITERQRVEATLKESEAYFRNTVEMLPEAIFETDLDTNVTYTNQAAYDLFGYCAADFGSCLSSLEMLVQEDGELAAERLARQLKGEKTGASEYNAMRKDGSTFPVLLHMKPMMREGELVGFLGIMIDITERKRAEEEKKHGERLSAALEMAGTVCHEFNQPLQVISGRIELLSMEYEDNRTQKTLNLIKDQVQRMGTITKKLMGLKKYSSRDYVGAVKITDIDQGPDTGSE